MRLRAFGGLWIESATPLPALGPRPLALLALVAASGKRGISRERAAGILWGDAGEDLARHSLSQNLYTIRRDTGSGWIVAGPRLSLNHGATSDIGEFVEAVASDDHERTARLYTGTFLQDFHLSGASEFERWVEEERTTLRRAALRALEALATRAGNGDAVQWWRRLTEIDGLNGQYAAGLIRALTQSGDLVAALAHARAHEEMVRRELEADVDPAVRTLITSLRAKAAGSSERPIDRAPATAGNALPAPSRSPGLPASRRLAVAGPALLGMLAVLVLFDRLRPASTPRDTAQPPLRPVVTGGSASPAAMALYQRGLQVYYRGDPITAHTLMRAAWEQDTTFAMAAFHGWLASTRRPGHRDDALLEAARRLAPRTIERERLLIASAVSGLDSGLATSLAIAETLAVRYPDDPEAHLALGTAVENMGDFPRAIAEFERAVAIDSAAGAEAGPQCRLCNTLYRMSVTYVWSDSLDAAVRTARRLRVLRPGETHGWAAIAEPLFRLGRRAEAQAALDSSEVHSIPTDQPREMGRRDMIRWGNFELLDRQLTADLSHPSAEVRSSAAWLMLLSLRNQGRLEAAKALASERREPTHLALLPLESGDPAEAARRFRVEAERRRTGAASPAARAGGVAWHLTLAGAALAEAGDTAGVRRLADSVERIGRQSSFGRDVRLHHYLRGLVHQRSGRHAEAIDQFRRATLSLTDGFTRINYEMARCLLQLGRPAEAIAVLRPALRGGVDGSNTYLTFTELHETIAQAFELAGARDSARAHYAAVERAWRRADPRFAARYAAARVKSAGP